MKTTIKADETKCGPATGSVNYPSLPEAGKMVMTQYTFAATICAAAPVDAKLMVDADHPLARFKPTEMTWAAFAPEMTFSGSPLIPVKLAE